MQTSQKYIYKSKYLNAKMINKVPNIPDTQFVFSEYCALILHYDVYIELDENSNHTLLKKGQEQFKNNLYDEQKIKCLWWLYKHLIIYEPAIFCRELIYSILL